ncbi:MAG: hypothetical protein ABFD60_04515 [Bryobacteraceae bacterium]
MRLRFLWAAVTAAAFSLSISQAQVINMSGTWNLNVQKSSWGKVQKPVSVLVTIEHDEPALKYSGNMVYFGGEDTRTFSFAGAIDGKWYPISRSYGSGKISMRRIDFRSMESEFRSDDGKWTEHIRTLVSRDGKELRRTIRRTGPEGNLNWTEVYDKR